MCPCRKEPNLINYLCDSKCYGDLPKYLAQGITLYRAFRMEFEIKFNQNGLMPGAHTKWVLRLKSELMRIRISKRQPDNMRFQVKNKGLTRDMLVPINLGTWRAVVFQSGVEINPNCCRKILRYRIKNVTANWIEISGKLDCNFDQNSPDFDQNCIKQRCLPDLIILGYL